MTQEHWDGANARCFGMLLDGWAQQTGIVRRGSGATLLLVYNAHFDVVNFTLPLVAEGGHGIGCLTQKPDAQRTIFGFRDVYVVTGKSMAAFAPRWPHWSRMKRSGGSLMIRALRHSLR
jgi:isoamylase